MSQYLCVKKHSVKAIVLFGAPGSGKGTQATRTSEEYDIPHVSTGEMFREAIERGTELGREVEPILRAGELVPDELTVALIRERLGMSDAEGGFVLEATTIQDPIAFATTLCDENGPLWGERLVEALRGFRHWAGVLAMANGDAGTAEIGRYGSYRATIRSRARMRRPRTSMSRATARTAALHLVLPVVVLAYGSLAVVTRMVRAGMIETLNQDFIRTARAKGLSERAVVLRHALRVGLVPVLTYLGPATAALVAGSFVIEKIFQIPGLGFFFVTTIAERDYPVLTGCLTFYIAFLVVLTTGFFGTSAQSNEAGYLVYKFVRSTGILALEDQARI